MSQSPFHLIRPSLTQERIVTSPLQQKNLLSQFNFQSPVQSNQKSDINSQISDFKLKLLNRSNIQQQKLENNMRSDDNQFQGAIPFSHNAGSEIKNEKKISHFALSEQRNKFGSNAKLCGRLQEHFTYANNGAISQNQPDNQSRENFVCVVPLFQKEKLTLNTDNSQLNMMNTNHSSMNELITEEDNLQQNQGINDFQNDQQSFDSQGMLNTTPLIRNSMRKIEANLSMCEDYNTNEISIVCQPQQNQMNQRQTQIQDRIQQSVIKAIEKYQEYKNEISFSTQFHNDSRQMSDFEDYEAIKQVNEMSAIHMKNDTHHEEDNDSILRTPIASKSIRNSIDDYDQSYQLRTAQEQNAPKIVTEIQSNYKRPVFDYQNRVQRTELKLDAPRKFEAFQPRFPHDDIKSVSKNLFESDFKQIDRNMQETPVQQIQQQVTKVITQQNDFHFQNIECIKRDDLVDNYLETPIKKSYQLIHNYDQHRPSNLSQLNYQVPFQSTFPSQRSVTTAFQSSTSSTQNLAINLDKVAVSPPVSLSNQDILSPTRITSRTQYDNILLSPNSAAQQPEGYQNLYRMIADLKLKVDSQQQFIQEKEHQYQHLQQEKEQISMELLQKQDQLDNYQRQDQVYKQIIEDKEAQIYEITLELKQSHEVRDQLQRQIESLKYDLQREIFQNKSERKKLQDMDEVLVVCKDQLQSFDSINSMSQQVIERLERQVGEYKFELDQAQSTIDKQHVMYYQLVQNFDSQKEQQPQQNLPIYQDRDVKMRSPARQQQEEQITKFSRNSVQQWPQAFKTQEDRVSQRLIDQEAVMNQRPLIYIEEDQQQMTTVRRNPSQQFTTYQQPQQLNQSYNSNNNYSQHNSDDSINQYQQNPQLQQQLQASEQFNQTRLNPEQQIYQSQQQQLNQQSYYKSNQKKKLVASPLKNTGNRLNQQRKEMLQESQLINQQQHNQWMIIGGTVTNEKENTQNTSAKHFR
eukprot:403344581